MGRVYGEKARPWVLVVTTRPMSTKAEEALAEVAPTRRVVTHEELANVRQSDYDAAIAISSGGGLSEHLHVLQFGGAPYAVVDYVQFLGGNERCALVAELGDRAERFVIGEAAIAERIESLVEISLLPDPGSAYPVLAWDYYGFVDAPPTFQAFATEFEGQPLAGRVPRKTGAEAELWWLPDRALDHAADWIKAAFGRWQREYPTTFPVAHAWADPAWTTFAEKQAEAALEAHVEEMTATITALEETAAALGAARDAVRAAADAHERRLLTAQDTDLVDEVAAALRELGFDVVDADTLRENQSHKQEDLRIADGEWVCLAEVKGYARRNARTADLLQLGRAVETFVLRERRRPDARWYIVNQSFATPPGQRSMPFQGSPDLATFEANDGLVIDTRDLFRLREAVRAGDMSDGEARRLLRESKGLFSPPTTA